MENLSNNIKQEMTMYSVRLGFESAKKRIKKLRKNGHYAEYLVTSMFTVEKTLRRTLRELIVSAGFTSKNADKLMLQIRGLDSIKKNWELFDPKERKITTVISENNWSQIKRLSKLRNDLVHGRRTYSIEKCRKEGDEIFKIMQSIKTTFDKEYGYSGWREHTKRYKSTLHSDPIV